VLLGLIVIALIEDGMLGTVFGGIPAYITTVFVATWSRVIVAFFAGAWINCTPGSRTRTATKTE
jgi:hypothetical protein